MDHLNYHTDLKMMETYDAKKAAQARDKIRLEELLRRLNEAVCWSDETAIGTQVTIWKNLSPKDLEMAKVAIQQLIDLR